MDTPEESRVSRSAKEGRIGPGGKPSIGAHEGNGRETYVGGFL
jgi:hypothetical protein